MNNYEKIKAMSMHKLTKFIKLLRESYCSEWDKPHTVAPCFKCVIKDLCDGIPNTTYSIKQWLQQESNPVEGSAYKKILDIITKAKEQEYEELENDK